MGQRLRNWIMALASLAAGPLAAAEVEAPATGPAVSGVKVSEEPGLQEWEREVLERWELLQNLELLEQMELVEDLQVLEGKGGEP